MAGSLTPEEVREIALEEILFWYYGTRDMAEIEQRRMSSVVQRLQSETEMYLLTDPEDDDGPLEARFKAEIRKTL